MPINDLTHALTPDQKILLSKAIMIAQGRTRNDLNRFKRKADSNDRSRHAKEAAHFKWLWVSANEQAEALDKLQARLKELGLLGNKEEDLI